MGMPCDTGWILPEAAPTHMGLSSGPGHRDLEEVRNKDVKGCCTCGDEAGYGFEGCHRYTAVCEGFACSASMLALMPVLLPVVAVAVVALMI